MESNGKAAVVLLSGGLDSSVLLHWLAKELGLAPIYALSFNYGQRHVRELQCAAAQAAEIGVLEHRVIDVSFMGNLLCEGSALLTGGVEIPDLVTLDSEALKQPPTYVPNRNMILLSMAVAYAEARGVCQVYYGAQAQDEYGYWDCTVEFLDHINATLSLNRRNAVTVYAPLITKSKAENVALGLKLGVDFAKTWSCYRGGDVACGTCPTCVERLKAFAIAGLRDPVHYAG